MRFNELMTGARQDVVCKIFGGRPGYAGGLCKKLGDIVTTVAGATDLYVETVTGLPQIVIHYNHDLLSNTMPADCRCEPVGETAFAGESAGMIYENERRFDLVVSLTGPRAGIWPMFKTCWWQARWVCRYPLYQVADVAIEGAPTRFSARMRIVGSWLASTSADGMCKPSSVNSANGWEPPFSFLPGIM